MMLMIADFDADDPLAGLLSDEDITPRQNKKYTQKETEYLNKTAPSKLNAPATTKPSTAAGGSSDHNDALGMMYTLMLTLSVGDFCVAF